MDPLLFLHGCALAGLASRPNGGHGITPRAAEDIGTEALALAHCALAAYEADATKPAATPAKAKR